LNRKYTAVPLSVLVALVAATGAQAQIIGIGDSSQSNDQGITSQQSGSQTAGGGIILGGGDQNAANNSDSTANNSQVSGGGLVVGDTNQANEQSVETGQGITQDAGGGTLTLIGGDQNAANNSTGTVNNDQTTVGLIVLGNTGQSNKQGVITSQMIGQDASAGIILFGGDQNAANNSATTDNSSQFIGFPFSLLILGDTAQDSGQADCTDQQIDQGADAGTLTLAGGDQNGANSGTTDKNNAQVRSAAIVPSRCARVSPPPPPPVVVPPPAVVPPPVVVPPPPAVKPVVKKKPKKKVVKKKKKKKKKARKPRRKRGFTG